MERIDDLQIKGLRLIQDTDLFMFGTDSVLLADFARVKKNTSVLDIGTGTGVICFLLYGRCDCARYTGIDIQQRSIELAKKSQKLNGIGDTMEFVCTDLKDFNRKGCYDLVCSNPPYERLGTGFTGGNDHVLTSRYEVAATLDDIVACAARSLKPKGRLCMVYKAERLAELTIVLKEHGLELKGIRTIHSKSGAAPRLILVEAMKGANSGVKWYPPLIMYDSEGRETQEVKRIYGQG